MAGNSPLENDQNHEHNSEPWNEELAQWYVTEYGDHPTNYKTIEVADLKPGDNILDIGCGSGTAVREAARRVTAGAVTGVDPSPAMIRIAKEKTVGTAAAARIRFHVGSAENLQAETGTITVALAINSVHHWADLPAGLAEIRRVLVPGGRLIVGEEAPDEQTGTSGADEYFEDIDPVQQALENGGFVNVTLSQHSISDGMMNILQASTPHER